MTPHTPPSKTSTSTLALVYFLALLQTSLQVTSSHSEYKQSQKGKKWNQVYIAILSQPNNVYSKILDTKEEQDEFKRQNSFITSSYVKYLEQSGAQSLLVPWDLPWAKLTSILDDTHGIILPGGGVGILRKTRYTKRIKEIYGWIKRKNDFGCSYAIWAVCLGLEEMLISRRKPVIDQGMNDHTEHDIKILNGKKNKFWIDPIFGSGHKKKMIENVFSNDENFFYSHNMGLFIKHYSNNPRLKSTVNVLGVSTTDDGKKFAAILEHRFYPFFMIQFHPEKNAWEHRGAGLKNLNRDEKTLQIVNGFMYNFIRYIRFLIDSELSNCGWKDKIGILSSQFLSWKYPVYPFLGMTYESLYLFKRLSHRELAIPDYVSSARFQDGIYHTYAMLRLDLGNAESNSVPLGETLEEN